jgi:hypothetical protein
LPFLMVFALATGSVVSTSRSGKARKGGILSVMGKIDYKCQSPCPIDAQICRCE